MTIVSELNKEELRVIQMITQQYLLKIDFGGMGK